MSSKIALTALLAVAMTGIHARSAAAQETVKVGIVIPMTGTSAAVGREISDAAKLYVAQHGNTVAGKKIELLIRDDQSVPDNAKRLAQELIVNDKVNFLGAGIDAKRDVDGADRDRSKSRDRGHGVGHFGGHRPLALLCAHEFHAWPAIRNHGRLGDQERQ